MIPELGLYCLILAFSISIVQGILPMAGTYLRAQHWMRMAAPLAITNFVLLSGSFAALTYCFITDDFSVQYVANNSNTLLPAHYKISAVWGAHEGSLLLWLLILCFWSAIFALFSRQLPVVLRARIISILGMITTGFSAFTLFTSNPFSRSLPFIPAEGSDLNPLLQDFGLVIHPPMLYFGYVGFAIPFAFAIAALLEKGAAQSSCVSNEWTRWVRPWANTAWAFLTVGIALGSWWAYYELGWGGWWFWDPVENASFMPWLAGTALLHSLAASDKRQLFSSWTLLLAIFAFSLSLLGTFLVRSGVLTSVHAFASDPSRGYFILVFLAIVIGCSLTLFALRAPTTPSSGYQFFSREMFVLLNSCLMAIILATVCLGTLYPLIADAMGWGKISVGPPYFDSFFVPLMFCVLLLLPVGVQLQWHDKFSLTQLFILWAKKPLIASLAFTPLLVLALSLPFSIQTLLATWLGLWVIISTLMDIRHKLRNARSPWQGLQSLRASYWGMCIAHIGLAVSVMGIAFTSLASEQKDLRLAPGQSTNMAGYQFNFESVEQAQGPNYTAEHAVFRVLAPNAELYIMRPEKRTYLASNQVMTEAAIWPGFTRDIYVSMGEALQPELGNASAWSLRLHVKPAVRWIWLGALLMALGAIIAVLDKRYSHRSISKYSTEKASA
ncbi:MAG: heme lyase CcmF/NrfE family subunit [Pseudomonadales bacterium]